MGLHAPTLSLLALVALGPPAPLTAVGPAHRAVATDRAAKVDARCGPDQIGDPGEPWMLMGHYTTNFPASAADRNFNMALAARRLCAFPIAPGATFSFNGALGQASRENGYRPGRVFVGDRIVMGYGGGVCQVASAVYNAARRAGLPIVERHQHGLTVPYLIPGEDATIAHGYLDLRFRNDTGNWLKLLVHADGGILQADIYGSRQPPDASYRHQFLGESGFAVIRQPDPTLPRGQEKVLAPGQKGVRVHTWLERRWPDSRAETLDLGIDDYRPSPRIIAYGTG